MLHTSKRLEMLKIDVVMTTATHQSSVESIRQIASGQCDELKESPWFYRRTRTNCPVLSTSFERVSVRDVSMHAVVRIPLTGL